jgi:hypothetical protein
MDVCVQSHIGDLLQPPPTRRVVDHISDAIGLGRLDNDWKYVYTKSDIENSIAKLGPACIRQ